MPGVVIRGGPSISPEIIDFNKSGLWQDGDLKHNGEWSPIMPFVVHSVSVIESVSVRITTPAIADITIRILRNAIPFLTFVLDAGQVKFSEDYSLGVYSLAAQDEVSCNISGGLAENISVQVRIV